MTVPPEGAPEGGRRRAWVRWTGSLLAILLLIWLLSRQGWPEIWAAVRQIPPLNLALALGLILVSRLAVVGRWQVLLRAAGVRLPHGRVAGITFAGLFASNFLPTTIGGDLVRLAGILQSGADRAIGGASIIVDRLVGMAGMATALPFGLPPLWVWLIDPAAGAAAAPAMTAVCSLSTGGLGQALGVRARQAIRPLSEAAAGWLRKPGAVLAAWLFTWLHMLSKFIAIWLLFDSMGQRLPLWVITGLWSFTYFITLVPISINGLGLQEISMAAIFAAIGGASMSAALSAALLVRTLETVASLPGAVTMPAALAGMQAETGQTGTS